MANKTDQKFLNLIDMLDGAKKKGDNPPVRVLIYNLQKDAFEVSRDAFDDTLNASISIDRSKKTLLLIHGTMAVTTNYVLDQKGELPKGANMGLGSFAELLHRDKKSPESFLKKWLTSGSKYEQVIAFDHLTLKEDVLANIYTLMELLPDLDEGGNPFCFERDVDIIAGSRGALVGHLLATSFSKNPVTREQLRNHKVPVGNLVFIAAGNGSDLLTFDRLASHHIGDKKIRYQEGLKTFVNALGLLGPIKLILKKQIDKYQDYIYQFMILPGIQNLTPGNPRLKEILEGVPASPSQKGTIDAKNTTYFPIVGKYDTEDYKALKGEIREIRRNAESKIRNFFLRLLLIHKLVGTQINRVFKKEVKVLKRLLFNGQDNDLVISSENQSIAPPKHYAEELVKKAHVFSTNKVVLPTSVAIHSFYLDREYLDEGISIKEKVQQFLEQPERVPTIV